MPFVEIRAARPADKDAVLAFCTHTWEWGDYIEYVWDEWLKDPQGLLLVATLDAQPAGVSHLRMATAQDAWLEGMRVDPQYRQHGIATALHQAMYREAISRGATHARLMTESGNTASISLCERGGFRRMGAFASFNAEPVADPVARYGPDMPQVASPADIDEIIDFLNASNIFPAIGGFYYHGFIAFPITAALLETKVAAGRIYLLRRWQRLDGLAIAEPRMGRQGRQLSLGYIDGTTESISLLAYILRAQLPALGLEHIYAYVPDLIMVRDAFVGAEYAWNGGVFYTYEKALI
jgi:GNAT superfamily N-acetyltransferase